MEINKYTDIIGVVAVQDVPEGRMVVLTPANASENYGSREDLMGVKLPANASDAARAKYVVAFALDNQPTPFLEGIPQVDWSMRGQWDQGTNLPAGSLTLNLTHKSNKLGLTVLSGTLALAYDRGVFTVYSGNFVPSASLVPGAYLAVTNVSDDTLAEAGKLKYSASAGVAIVEKYDSTNQTLQFRTL